MSAVAAIVVGHRRSAQGAVSVDGTSEWIWNGAHALRLRAALLALGVESVIVQRPDTSDGYGKLPGIVNHIDPACAVSLHFNGATSSATGSEVLFWQWSQASRSLAQALANSDDVLGLRDRGLGGIRGRGYCVTKRRIDARGRTRWDLVLGGPIARKTAADKAREFGDGYRFQPERGTPLLRDVSCPAVIVEPFFGSNATDWRVVNERADELAVAQAQAIAGWLESRAS
jgi:N-acetylmuramoyl-L-alanine amidase